MVLRHIGVHSLIYFALVIGYLGMMMVTFPARVWGLSDYSDEIKARISPQSPHEKRLAALLALPYVVIALGFPLWSTWALKARLGGVISYWLALLNILSMVMLAWLGDLIILDWLIVSKLCPPYVRVPGTTKADYADFSHHYRGHLVFLPGVLALCFLLADVVWLI